MHDKNDRFSWHSKGQSLTSSFFTTSRAAWQWWLAEMAWLIKPVTHRFVSSQSPLVLVTDKSGNYSRILDKPGQDYQNTNCQQAGTYQQAMPV